MQVRTQVCILLHPGCHGTTGNMTGGSRFDFTLENRHFRMSFLFCLIQSYCCGVGVRSCDNTNKKKQRGEERTKAVTVFQLSDEQHQYFRQRSSDGGSNGNRPAPGSPFPVNVLCRRISCVLGSIARKLDSRVQGSSRMCTESSSRMATQLAGLIAHVARLAGARSFAGVHRAAWEAPRPISSAARCKSIKTKKDGMAHFSCLWLRRGLLARRARWWTWWPRAQITT